MAHMLKEQLGRFRGGSWVEDCCCSWHPPSIMHKQSATLGMELCEAEEFVLYSTMQ